jgi:hypothetical protein
MKKLLFLISIFLISFSTAKAQSNYTTIGESGGGPYCIWKINVSDEFNNRPLRNAKVELYEDTYKIFSIRTNNEGIAVVIIYDITKLQNGLTLKVNDERYLYTSWEKNILQFDYYGKRSQEKMLILGNSNNQIINWSDGNNLPSSAKIANDIILSRYKIFESRNSNNYYRGPGFFEFNVSLNRYEHNSESNRSINNSEDDKSPSEYKQESNISGEWREFPPEEGGNIYKIYIKGNIKVMLSEPELGEFTITECATGETISYCIDEFGNRTEYKAYSKSEAIRIINSYMRNH